MVKADAPVKLNLHLAVKDKRSDGFHNLESVFLALDFGDTLHFEAATGKNSLDLAMTGDQAPENHGLPVEKNIIFRALSLFRGKTGFEQGLKVTVDKQIPIGGGLGGGSSDAASTLLTLNKMAGFPLSRDALLEMAASLGSDVPFFIYETAAAWVSGRGEIIKPLEAPLLHDFSFVLVNPGFPSDTAEAYRLFDSSGNSNHRPTPANADDILSKPPQEWNFRNDFLPVFPEREKSVYSKIISRLRELGADFASLSGAGSTCFGVFREKAQAKKAAALMRNAYKFAEYCGAKE